jgi:uncharacterized membrane protein YqgA involved in biofilm formation
VVIPWGSIINSAATIVGGSLGLFLGNLIPERVRLVIFQLFGLFLIPIGLQMVQKSSDLILAMLSAVLGGGLGETLKIGTWLDSLGDRLKKILGSKNPAFTDGLVTCSVMVCAGAMAIVGSFEEGLGHGRTTLMTKTLIDFFAVAVMASRLGSGAIWAAVPLLVYQGLLTMGAGFLQPMMTVAIENCISATGGILVMGIGVNMLGLKPPISISSCLPALIFAAILPAIFG